jgi:hypothetical protein
MNSTDTSAPQLVDGLVASAVVTHHGLLRPRPMGLVACSTFFFPLFLPSCPLLTSQDNSFDPCTFSFTHPTPSILPVLYLSIGLLCFIYDTLRSAHFLHPTVLRRLLASARHPCLPSSVLPISSLPDQVLPPASINMERVEALAHPTHPAAPPPVMVSVSPCGFTQMPSMVHPSLAIHSRKESAQRLVAARKSLDAQDPTLQSYRNKA